jgi:uncharacterized C2H2 Zn-finger protein
MKIYKCGNCNKIFKYPYGGLCPRCGHNSFIEIRTDYPELINQLHLFNKNSKKALKKKAP